MIRTHNRDRSEGADPWRTEVGQACQLERAAGVVHGHTHNILLGLVLLLLGAIIGAKLSSIKTESAWATTAGPTSMEREEMARAFRLQAQAKIAELQNRMAQLKFENDVLRNEPSKDSTTRIAAAAAPWVKSLP